jgi:hypothetical protein
MSFRILQGCNRHPEPGCRKRGKGRIPVGDQILTESCLQATSAAFLTLRESHRISVGPVLVPTRAELDYQFEPELMSMRLIG